LKKFNAIEIQKQATRTGKALSKNNKNTPGFFVSGDQYMSNIRSS
jgi:hypothetical protein